MNLRRFLKFFWRPRRYVRAYIERKLLNNVSGVVHVGANAGQERKTYSRYGLDVVWVEPIPEVFDKLVENTRGMEKQVAYQSLITDKDGQEYEFHIANNEGQSSSILQLKHHREMWPEVHYTGSITLQSMTLFSLFKKEGIDPKKYQGLVMDTQGSELLVLKGAKTLLDNFKFIKTEVADFELYEDCCQLDDINEFMTRNGFVEAHRIQFGKKNNKQMRCFNIYYVRVA